MTNAQTAPSRRTLAAKIILASAAAWTLPPPPGAEGDDTHLFRAQSAKPYVYLVVDTSSSMNMSSELRASPQDPPVWLPTGADDPRSMFHQVRSAIAEVLDTAYREHGDFVHFGFATFDQNHLRLRGKHWRYVATGDGSVDIGGTPYPAAGEELTFGAHLPTTAGPANLPIPASGQLGSCAAPVAFGTHREAVNRFPKLHPVDTTLDGSMELMEATRLWLEEAGTKYELVVSQGTAGDSGLLGDSPLTVDFSLSTWSSDCDTLVSSSTASVVLDSPRQFFIHDLVDDSALGMADGFSEADGGVWLHQDAEADGRCRSGPHPHSGWGWEGNYDGGTLFEPPGELSDTDPFCDAGGSGDCGTLKLQTVLHPNTLEPGEPVEWRTLDEGDHLPYHWQRSQREQLMRRLAPNWTPGKPFAELDFSLAPYFKDVPNEIGFLELQDPAQTPLVPFGASALAEALTDWRCFYLGSDGAPGSNGSNGDCEASNQPFGRGFDWLAPQYDLDWGCRRPRLLVVTDGENNCAAEDPAAAAIALKKNGVETWVINLGPTSEELRELAEGTAGLYFETVEREELIEALEDFVGAILAESHTLTSAVVPTGGAEEADRIFLTDFTPLDGESVWRGDLRGFLKPLPLDSGGRPAIDIECGTAPGSAPQSECLMWSAGVEMLTQVAADIQTQFGPSPTQRRVFYSRQTHAGGWPDTRRYLSPTSSSMSQATAVRYDLWRALGLIPSDTADGSLGSATETHLESEANGALINMMALKNDDNGTPNDPNDDTPFILGDVFHSNPLIVDAPANSRYFALDLRNNGTECEAGNPSYRCFYRKHQQRRRVVLVGSNDAQVHAIDAGIARTSGPFGGERDRGSGHEVFAFTPRGVMSAVKDMYGDGLSRTWTVDGSLTAIDAFIDPLDDGADFPDPGDREWRTVVIGGLRRGGESYFALDLTQPDTYDGDGAPSGIDYYVPSCLDGGVGCGPLPYPAQLWEFTDSWLLEEPPRQAPFDTDQDGFEDMVGTWSVPSLGLMKVCTGSSCDPADPGNHVEDRAVAVFGGGLDKSNTTGNWLYIVDIETGEAIYKRQLLDTDGITSGGAVASEVAAVDIDNDGFLDRIYTPTLIGYVYRTDLYGPNGEIPRLESEPDIIDAGQGTAFLVEVTRITDDDYRPRVIFKAQPDTTTAGPSSRAIYHRPSVIYSAALGGHVLAVGTGDREDLWTDDGSRGVFYLVRDDIAADDFSTFYTEDDLIGIDSEVDGDSSGDLLTDTSLTSKGWYLLLGHQERLITDPLAIAGMVVFTVFDPEVNVDPETLTCSRGGSSRVFGVAATNGNGVLFADGERVRAIKIDGFVAEPWVEPSTTGNPPSEGEGGGATADELSTDHLQILEELKELLPSNCRFANHRLDIKALSSDTGVHLIAPIPVCIVEKNWKEF